MKDKKEAILNFLIGQVMKRTNGAADPKIVRAMLIERLEGKNNGNQED